MPDAPIGFDESTPPDGFHGMSPSGAVAPASVSFQPSPSAQNPRFSSHIGSYHENGTYTSAQSKSLRGIGDAGLRVHVLRAVLAGLRVHLIAAGEHRRLAAHRHAVDPRDRARRDASATFSLPITIAIAPSDDGHTSR